MKKIFENILILVMKSGVQFQKVEDFFRAKLFSPKSIIIILFLIFASIGLFGMFKIGAQLFDKFDILSLLFFILILLLTLLFLVLTFSLLMDIRIIKDGENFKIKYPNELSLEKRKELSEMKTIVTNDNLNESFEKLNELYFKCSLDSYKSFLKMEPLTSEKISWCDKTEETRFKRGNLQSLLEFIKIIFDLDNEEYQMIPEIVELYFLDKHSKKYKFHENTITKWQKNDSVYFKNINLHLKKILFV